jgi:hypothetical protein
MPDEKILNRCSPSRTTLRGGFLVTKNEKIVEKSPRKTRLEPYGRLFLAQTGQIKQKQAPDVKT